MASIQTYRGHPTMSLEGESNPWTWNSQDEYNFFAKTWVDNGRYMCLSCLSNHVLDIIYIIHSQFSFYMLESGKPIISWILLCGMLTFVMGSKSFLGFFWKGSLTTYHSLIQSFLRPFFQEIPNNKSFIGRKLLRI